MAYDKNQDGALSGAELPAHIRQIPSRFIARDRAPVQVEQANDPAWNASNAASVTESSGSSAMRKRTCTVAFGVT